MPSVIRRKDTKRYPFWYACYTDANGRRVKKSTGLTSRSKALVFAAKLEEAVRFARQRTLTEARARELVSEIVASVHGGDGLRSYTVRAWFEHFVKIKNKSTGPDTAARYQQIGNEFLEFLGAKADLNILAITGAHVRAFRDHRPELSAVTVNNRFALLSAYFAGARRANVISGNPCTEVEAVRDNVSPAHRRRQPFTIEQVAAILSVANQDWQGAIKAALYTGARIQNIVTLRWRNLDLQSDPPLIVYERYSKFGDQHVVPAHPALESHLLNLPAPDDPDAYVFPTLATRRVTYLSRDFRRLLASAHIANWKVREVGKGAARTVWALSFHSLRRTHITELANAGVSEEIRAQVVAHHVRSVHLAYTHGSLGRMHEAVSKSLPAL
jgi:integrase